jgi:hypothetical protein
LCRIVASEEENFACFLLSYHFRQR